MALSATAFAGVPVARTVDVSATIKPVVLEAYAGETLDLSMQLMSGGMELATPSASATIYWQTNGMAGAWWQTNLACSATGKVTGRWSPSLPMGRVWFFVGVNFGGGLNYRIAGQCTVLPSPGGAPSSAVLPAPGGTLNLGDYTIIGAPWITAEDSAAAIAAATAPIASDVASISSRVSQVSQASSNYTASVAGSVGVAASAASNYTDSVVAPLSAATNALNARLDSLAIPDVSGLASKSEVQSASNSLAGAIQGLSMGLENTSNALAQATAALAQVVTDNAQQAGYDLGAASNALAQATVALSQTVADNAQQAGYDLAAASNALAQATAALAQVVAGNAQQAGYDLAAASNALAQATAALAQVVADNAQQAGYDLAAASNALAQATAALSQTVAYNAQQSSSDLISATNALHMSLAPTISAAATALQPSASNALAQATAALAQTVAGIKMAQAVSNAATRLVLPSGDAYMDATGVVWQAYATNRWSKWHVLEWQPDTDTPAVETNEIPGVADWAITWEARESELGLEEWNWVLKAPAGGTALGWAYAPEGEENATNIYVLIGGDNPQTFPVWRFGRTNEIVRGYAPARRLVDEGYVTNSIAEAMADLPPPQTMTTNDVQAIVTNTTPVVSTPWRCEWPESYSMIGGILWDGSGWVVDPDSSYNPMDNTYVLEIWNENDDYDCYAVPNPEDPEYGNPNAIQLTLVQWHWDDGVSSRVAARITRTYTPSRNSLGLARLSDLPPLTNGIPEAVAAAASAAQAATTTNAQQSVTLSSHTSQLSQLSQTVGTWETFWDGDEVRVTVTNYYASQDVPALYIEEKNQNTNTYKVVWDERTRWASNAVQMAALNAAIDEKADRAWGYYDSHTGNYAPDGYTWLSSPKIAIAGGLAYQRTLTVDGAVWVLASNGMVAQTGGTIEDGFFRIKDDEGNTTFEIVRGNKRTVGATAAGIQVTRSGSSNIVTVPYNVVSEEHPTIYGTVSLSSPEWAEIEATWTGSSGAWTAQVTTATSTYFIKAEYEIGGETYIKNVAPISAEGGIYCTDGIHKVRPVYNNGTVTWEVVTP